MARRGAETASVKSLSEKVVELEDLLEVAKVQSKVFHELQKLKDEDVVRAAEAQLNHKLYHLSTVPEIASSNCLHFDL